MSTSVPPHPAAPQPTLREVALQRLRAEPPSPAAAAALASSLVEAGIRPAPVPYRLGVALAVAAPVATGAALCAATATLAPMVAAPGVALGVAIATSPALYIALAASGEAPPFRTMARSCGVALAAFGVALCGLVMPATFLSLSSVKPLTAAVAVTAALAGAALLGIWRLAIELRLRSGTAEFVFGVWAIATCGIAGRIWFDVAREALS